MYSICCKTTLGDTLKKFYYTKTDSGKMFLWSILVPQLLGAVFVILLTGFARTEEAYSALLDNIFIQIIMVMLAQIGFLIVYFTYNRNIDFKRASKINFKLGWKNTLICVLIGLIGVFGLNPLISCVDTFLDFIGYNLSTSLPLPLDNFGWLILNIILLAGVPAILEELVFRGVILNGYKKLGALPAMLVTSLLFALIHGSLQQFVFPFLFGLILSFVALKTGSVVAPMIIHFINNALVVILNYVNFNFEVALPTWAFALISVAICAVAFVAIWLLGKLFKNVDKPISLTPEQQEQFVAMENAEVKSNLPIILGAVLGGVFLLIDILSGLGVIAL